MSSDQVEYIIEGGWHGGVSYEVFKTDGDGRSVYGGPGYRLRDCKSWIKQKHSQPMWEVSFKTKRVEGVLAVCVRRKQQ